MVRTVQTVRRQSFWNRHRTDVYREKNNWTKYQEKETKFRNDLPWALGRTVLHDITTKFGDKSADMKKLRVIASFHQEFTQARKITIGLAKYFGRNRYETKHCKQHWKKLCPLEKDWACKSIAPAEFLVSNFIILSSDTKLRYWKLNEYEITVKLFMNRIGQDTLVKTHGSESIRQQRNKIKRSTKFREKRRTKLSRNISRFFCDTRNWTIEHKSTAKGGSCRKCAKIGTMHEYATLHK